ncbi:MAG: NRDE family protein [Burkholderiales bacterium]|nr:NRDE family protein [Burkholderiales bacterium]
MCLIAFALDSVPGYRLLVAANRDEFHSRPTAPAAHWHDAPGVFAGRDLREGGTWMGLALGGRFAALTNHRNGAPAGRAPRSRGHLVAQFLRTDADAEAYADQVGRERRDYNGFNLLVGCKGEFWVIADDDAPRRVERGLHTLSNARLDTPWPKATGLAADVASATRAGSDENHLFAALFAALADARPAAEESLPDTGIGIIRERELSPRMIVNPVYGTRSASVLAIRSDGSTRFEETSFDAEGQVIGRIVAAPR